MFDICKNLYISLINDKYAKVKEFKIEIFLSKDKKIIKLFMIIFCIFLMIFTLNNFAF